MMAGFEMAGAAGAMLGGWIADRYVGGRAAPRVRGFIMLVVHRLDLGVLEIAGRIEAGELRAALAQPAFFVYGPQCLLARPLRISPPSAPPPPRSA